MARPRQPYTEREQKLIIALYEMGMTDKQIADALHVPRTTFLDRCKYTVFYEHVEGENEEDFPKLVDIIKNAKEVADLLVEASLYQEAKDGNLGAICVWLFNRHPDKWKTVQHIKLQQHVQDVIGEMTPKETDELFTQITNKK